MALTNQFELNTYAWEDDVDDLPITYTFAYVSGSANESDTSGEVVLQAASESSGASGVYLPQVGGPGAGASFFLFGGSREVFVFAVMVAVRLVLRSVLYSTYLSFYKPQATQGPSRVTYICRTFFSIRSIRSSI